jgi:hypothetical protein
MVVSKDGQILATHLGRFANYQSATDCGYILNSALGTIFPDDWTDLNNLTYAFLNNNRTITMFWRTAEGATQNVGWKVVLADAYGNSTICDTSMAGSTGGFTCNIPQAFGNVTVTATPRINGQQLGAYSIHLGDNPDQIWGGTKVILGIMLYTTLILMFMADAIMIVVGAVLGFVLLTALYLIDGGTGVSLGVIIVWFIIASVIIIWQLSKKMNSPT